MNCKPTRQEYESRMDELYRFPLREILDTNPLCRKIAEEYAHGGIIHKDEALAQMVVHMHHSNSILHVQYIELIQRSCAPSMTVTP